jgi:hypothetical protein
MHRTQIESQLNRDPFVPLRLRLTDGRGFDVPFRHVIVFQKSRLILFMGVKREGSHAATGFELLPYDQIDRIEERPGRAGRQRKAS